jgi:hypothetical protein
MVRQCTVVTNTRADTVVLVLLSSFISFVYCYAGNKDMYLDYAMHVIGMCVRTSHPIFFVYIYVYLGLLSFAQ